ncbi:hydrogen peroxide-dependent heme synthase [Brevibacillus daliensis]|uniref:hydrogen peroxide-dependent heme synthase n=1 Tax=Brevibacillus daliensis TaxID=2892995 RepID=UPI001E608057|nr:hydrogen peroxide-dependent heme synthase [Brevibacillus daliensis]
MSANEALLTLEGWFSYHDFRKIDWGKWKAASEEERTAAIDELQTLMNTWQDDESATDGSTSVYSVLGHKADLSFIFLRPTINELEALKTAFNKSRFADYTTTDYSYISVVELSNYVNNPGEDPKANPHVRERLYPVMPKWNHFCFYPMNKKRGEKENWYSMSMEERRDLMRVHGLTGRKYAGKIKQIIGGSVGYDDWEWGVTLFAHDPLDLKHIVYEMRFDEVSARFGEFGDFLVGNYVDTDSVKKMLQV